ncbi:MAG: acetyl-CoA carboxylase biotin carboxyl carrier protein subunit [Saprospiraceae bacterium]|nr:acetyl-CoA carboxylase biotin carboxyl carrier protein subunit [Saprospiraceae bacterium]
MAYQIFINNSDQGIIETDIMNEGHITTLDGRRINVRLNGVNHFIECLECDLEKKTIRLMINDAIYNLELLDEVDQMVDSLGLEAGIDERSSDVIAPMPGKILEYRVKVGQEVQEGDPLVILEAMKMENILKATGPGVIEEIHGDPGQTVDKGTLLITLE